jgi:hypothetical protein
MGYGPPVIRLAVAEVAQVSFGTLVQVRSHSVHFPALFDPVSVTFLLHDFTFTQVLVGFEQPLHTPEKVKVNVPDAGRLAENMTRYPVFFPQAPGLTFPVLDAVTVFVEDADTPALNSEVTSIPAVTPKSPPLTLACTDCV